jgi:hypothetical protein
MNWRDTVLNKDKIFIRGVEGLAGGAMSFYVLYIVAILVDISNGATFLDAVKHNQTTDDFFLLFMVWFSFGIIAAAVNMIIEYLSQKRRIKAIEKVKTVSRR